MARTINGETLINDNGNFNEQVWIMNLIAIAELMGIKKEDGDSDDERTML